MTKAKLVAGNWKMNGTAESAINLARQIVDGCRGKSATVALFPPHIHIPYVADITKGKAVVVGGQDCHEEEAGAFTGNISAAMLKDLACQYVIVGHSERRQLQGENNQQVKKKAERAIQHDIIPIICIGETLEERESGKANKVIYDQIKKSIPKEATTENTIIAYEPVWAIGTGRVATSKDIKEMHSHINKSVKDNFPGFKQGVQILYGGSVKGKNAKEILSTEGVGGVLVGGASLDAKDFLTIVKEAG